MTKDEIKRVLDAHALWLCDPEAAGSKRADLQGADLQWANLKWASLQGANLQEANLQWASLQGAELQGAELQEANLQGARLQEASLQGANLQEANLQGASLQGAELQGANLQWANLQGANLQGANLQGASNNYLTSGVHAAPEGDLIAWKKIGESILKLRIPAEAKRSCATTRKHRSEYAVVLEIDDGAKSSVTGGHGGLTYSAGCRIDADSWDEDRWNECSNGIHWFLSRAEAEAY